MYANHVHQTRSLPDWSYVVCVLLTYGVKGGIHVGAFVSGGWLPQERRGIKVGGLAALWDLYATFGHLAGLSAADTRSDAAAEAAGLPAIDSVDQWDWWSGKTTVPPRLELPVGTAFGSSHGGGNAFMATSVQALIWDKSTSSEGGGMIKLILTDPHTPIDEAIWTGPQYPNASSNMSTWDTAVDCSHGCLFNLVRAVHIITD